MDTLLTILEFWIPLVLRGGTRKVSWKGLTGISLDLGSWALRVVCSINVIQII
jgi:hypothetical protein